VEGLTRAFLQQETEGLYCWMDAEMKHRSKDWPVFDFIALCYIAWKQKWTAHHVENCPGLQGSALRKCW
jgi:hypothetical protein